MYPYQNVGMIGRVATCLGLALNVTYQAIAQPPKLILKSDESTASVAAQIEQSDQNRLFSVMRLVGLTDPGSPITVVLASEQSNLAQNTPRSIAGFALAEPESVILFPGRAPSYPHDSLDALLQHEVAHVLIARAANGRTVPRWFNEGLAMAAERSWTLEDRTRLKWEVIWGGRIHVAEIDEMFGQGQQATVRAYALSGALVRDFLQNYDPMVGSRILSLLSSDYSFADAFYQATGDSISKAEEAFWARQQLWERWIPLLTRPFTIWTIITILALYAIWKHRQRRIIQRRIWEEEEQKEILRWNQQGRGPTIH